MNIISIIIAIILFSIIVIFHELGHFWLAKANGIKVNEFCLGLGPTLFGVQRGETKYSIKMLPFGGACIMEGEDESSGDDRAFNNKSVWARISVVFAGPFFNFIMAFIFALIITNNITCSLIVSKMWQHADPFILFFIIHKQEKSDISIIMSDRYIDHNVFKHCI